jgi:hypothetical protein
MAGNYIQTACQFTGIGNTTYFKWRTRGETELDRVSVLPRTNVDEIMDSFDGKDPEYLDKDGNPMSRGTAEYMWTHRPPKFLATEWPFVVFKWQTEKAEAAAEVRILQNINTAAQDGNWQAGAWVLERKRPERWGRRERISLEGPEPGSPVEIEQRTVITVDALNHKLEELVAGKRKAGGGSH